ncbi:hypothetical protein D2T33_07895 [Sinirhodobacter populi]|uniref:Uncharacterized protein n=1 Tax=Paenirhodobacter populi TaxID=2306993 RepID=A0A443IYC8_9RHOB|nr:hypothetical protein D2T33_07895 [Sinirhodobacter populi]
MDGFRVARGFVIFGNWSGAAMYSASDLRFAELEAHFKVHRCVDTVIVSSTPMRWAHRNLH